MLRRVAPLLLLLALALPAAPASAKRTRPFWVFAGTTDTKGDGEVAGEFIWKNRARHLRVRGTIDDLCPADGFRTQAIFKIHYASFKTSTTGFQVDGRGCKASPQRFTFDTGLFDDGSRIYAIDVTVWEYDEEAELGGDGDQTTVTYYRPG